MFPLPFKVIDMNTVVSADAKLRLLSERLGALESRQSSPLRRNPHNMSGYIPASPVAPVAVDNYIASSPIIPPQAEIHSINIGQNHNEALYSVMSKMQGRVDEVHNAVDQNITGLRSRVATASNRIDELTDTTSQKLIILTARIDCLENENKELREKVSNMQLVHNSFEEKVNDRISDIETTIPTITSSVDKAHKDISEVKSTDMNSNTVLRSEIDALKVKLESFSSALSDETRKTDSLSKTRVEEIEQVVIAKTDIIENRTLHSSLAINFKEFSMELSKRVMSLEDGLAALCRQQTRDRAVAVAAAVSSSTLTPQSQLFSMR